jgi:RNA recognition motif-containing protein
MCRFSHSGGNSVVSADSEPGAVPSAAKPSPTANAKMFVGNVAAGTTPKQLKDIFTQFGPLRDKEVDIKGMFAFVYFENRADMEKALAGGPYIIAGEQLKCEESREQKKKPEKDFKISRPDAKVPSSDKSKSGLSFLVIPRLKIIFLAPSRTLVVQSGGAVLVGGTKPVIAVAPPTLFHIEALYDRDSVDPREISFKRGDVLQATTKPDANGWVNARRATEVGHGRLAPYEWFKVLS